MTQELNLAQKIRAMKIGDSFTVETEYERQTACRIGKNLRQAGVIEFEVITKSKGSHFKVAAI